MLLRNTLVLLTCALMLWPTSALWDFAVTTKSKILFYDDNWRELTSSAHQFEQLAALAFDETEETVYFSDQMHSNGSVFSLRLPSSSRDPHLIEKLVQSAQNESITSIAYDPVKRNLFWADRRNRKIYSRSIDDARAETKPHIFLDLADEEALPDGIAIDVCRRQLYWTNSNFQNASIERIGLDGSGRTLVAHSNLYLPHGIVVDQLSDRLYWVVDQPGMHFSVESAQLDGSDRQVIVQGLNNVPFSLAVTRDSLYWTDLTHNAVWSSLKTLKGYVNETEPSALPEPHQVAVFADAPRGIVTRTNFLTSLQGDEHCALVVRELRNRLLTPKPTLSLIDSQVERLQREYCLNGGEYSAQSGVCVCQLGYKGARCESSECHNYCVHGTCAMSAAGFPKCMCQRGFYGERCQSYKCTRYCFNDGLCRIESGGEPACECPGNYGGQRCEQNSTEICALFCRVLKHEPELYVPFGCHDICKDLADQTDAGADQYAIPRYQHLEVCKHSAWNGALIAILLSGVVGCLCLVLLIVHALRRYYKPARPHIKKTFVIRKHARSSSSDTPLTNRPLATEQCEITIENCCNMNICDTPCFDPKLVQQSLARDINVKEDRKMLVHNMEDELY